MFHIKNDVREHEGEGDGGTNESYSLRFDQTVPFSRYVKQNGIVKMRRCQIGKVFRRDQPNMKSCRLREFIQADYDFVGADDVVYADAETLKMMFDVMRSMPFKSGCEYDWIIRINTVPILNDLLRSCGVPEEMYKTVCSSIDKLDKKDFKFVQSEIISKGVSEGVAVILIDKLKRYKTLLLSDVLNDTTRPSFISQQNFEYISTLYNDYLCVMMSKSDINSKLTFDLTLARGLDYYTGLIMEVTTKKVGSVAGGGRYDKICGVGCVGFSVGIDRLMGVLEPVKPECVKVWVIQTDSDPSVLNDLYKYRISVVNRLRESGVSVGTECKKETGMGNQLRYVLKKQIPYCVFVGENELRSETLSLKCMATTVQKEMKLEQAVNIIVGLQK